MAGVPFGMRIMAAAVGVCCAWASGQTTFKVSFEAGLRAEAATGRLVVYLIREGAKVGDTPASGPFFHDPQPMFGVDVKNLRPGEAVEVGDGATSFPVVLSNLPAGAYRAQVVLDLHRDNSDWKREPGNLASDVLTIRLGETDRPAQISIPLTTGVAPRGSRPPSGVKYVEVRSELLSAFHGREIKVRAGVVPPIGFEPAGERRYAAVYEVPGFGGDHTGAARDAAAAARTETGTPEGVIARECFWIVLDPESGNGHTLFADSENNGPCGKALITELIPALEAQFPLKRTPEARLLRGHSSGGWSTLWLALTYPETFGATWSSAPDPVDFRKFQLPNIYRDASLYFTTGDDGKKSPIPSYRAAGESRMTIEQENLMEEVLGPGNTSGQQWDSWFAVWGPRGADGNPAALIDPKTGAIDRAVAERYRAYDIGELVRRHPETYGRILRERCRIIVGDQDSYYLNEAVALLREDSSKMLARDGKGRIEIVPGLDHGSIFNAPTMRQIPQEMMEHLRAHSLITK